MSRKNNESLTTKFYVRPKVPNVHHDEYWTADDDYRERERIDEEFDKRREASGLFPPRRIDVLRGDDIPELEEDMSEFEAARKKRLRHAERRLKPKSQRASVNKRADKIVGYRPGKPKKMIAEMLGLGIMTVAAAKTIELTADAMNKPFKQRRKQ